MILLYEVIKRKSNLDDNVVFIFLKFHLFWKKSIIFLKPKDAHGNSSQLNRTFFGFKIFPREWFFFKLKPTTKV